MKVGDYLRTKHGEIRKIVKVTDDLFQLDKDIIVAHIDDIVKSSPNIIDLIEVGDYVNGHTVKMIKEDKSKIDIGEGEDYFWLRNQDILSIVTKEQFESMEYKIN